MKRKIFAAALFACAGGFIFAADENINEGIPIQSDWDGNLFSGYSTGDKTFMISAGTLIPLFFTGASYNLLDNKMKLGGIGMLSYAYYITPKIFSGGDISFSFSSTLGEIYIYTIPMSAFIGYQFMYKRFEIPILGAIGPAIHVYQGKNLISLQVKAQGGFFYRMSQQWAFGGNLALSWMPEWTNIPEQNAYGHFLTITVSAMYHF